MTDDEAINLISRITTPTQSKTPVPKLSISKSATPTTSTPIEKPFEDPVERFARTRIEALRYLGEEARERTPKPVKKALRYMWSPYERIANVLMAGGRGIVGGVRGLQEYNPRQADEVSRLYAENQEKFRRGEIEGIPIPEMPENVHPITRAFQAMANKRPEDNWGAIIREESARRMIPPIGEDPQGERWQSMVRGVSEPAGVVGDLLVDPVWAASPFGLTKAGMMAEKTGKPLATLGEQAEKGHRALLSVGQQPIIRGEGVLKALTDLRSGVENRKILGAPIRAFRPVYKTSHSGYNEAAENFLSAESEAGMMAAQKERKGKATTEWLAKRYGKTPEEVRSEIREYLEPTGSQNLHAPSLRRWEKRPSAEAEIEKRRKTLLADMPQMMRPVTKRIEAENKAFVESERPIKEMLKPGEGHYENPFYSTHILDKNFEKFIEKNKEKFGDKYEAVKSMVGIKSAKGGWIPEFEQRGVKMTVNEINKYSQEGNLKKVPGFEGFPVLNEYKGKVFDEQLESVQAIRYLHNAKVRNQADFVGNVEKNWGKSVKEMEEDFGNTAGKFKREDWGLVSSPLLKGGEAYFPKPIANSLNAVEKLKSSGELFPTLDRIWRPIRSLITSHYYSIWPSSVVQNKTSNSLFRFLHGIYDPESEVIGFKLAKALRERVGRKHLSRVAISNQHGTYTYGDILDISQQHRGRGLGLVKFERGEDVETNVINKLVGAKGKVAVPGNYAQDFVEDWDRMATVYSALKRGYTPKGAGRLSRMVNLDYSEMGTRDMVIHEWVPFYTFARKNMPRMLGLSVTKPGLYSSYGRVHGMQNAPVAGERELMPEWDVQSMPIWTGQKDQNGDNVYLFPNRFLAQLDINKWFGSGKTVGEQIKNTPKKFFEQAVGMIPPVGKLPVELVENKSMFFHKPISKMPGEVKQTFPGILTPAQFDYAAKNYRPIGEAARLFDETKPLPQRLSKFLLGVDVRPLDASTAKMFKAKKFKSELTELQGLARIYAIEGAKARKKGFIGKEEEARENMKRAIELIKKKALEEGPNR